MDCNHCLKPFSSPATLPTACAFCARWHCQDCIRRCVGCNYQFCLSCEAVWNHEVNKGKLDDRQREFVAALGESLCKNCSFKQNPTWEPQVGDKVVWNYSEKGHSFRKIGQIYKIAIAEPITRYYVRKPGSILNTMSYAYRSELELFSEEEHKLEVALGELEELSNPSEFPVSCSICKKRCSLLGDGWISAFDCDFCARTTLCEDCIHKCTSCTWQFCKECYHLWIDSKNFNGINKKEMKFAMAIGDPICRRCTMREKENPRRDLNITCSYCQIAIDLYDDIYEKCCRCGRFVCDSCHSKCSQCGHKHCKRCLTFDRLSSALGEGNQFCVECYEGKKPDLNAYFDNQDVRENPFDYNSPSKEQSESLYEWTLENEELAAGGWKGKNVFIVKIKSIAINKTGELDHHVVTSAMDEDLPYNGNAFRGELRKISHNEQRMIEALYGKNNPDSADTCTHCEVDLFIKGKSRSCAWCGFRFCLDCCGKCMQCKVNVCKNCMNDWIKNYKLRGKKKRIDYNEVSRAIEVVMSLNDFICPSCAEE